MKYFHLLLISIVLIFTSCEDYLETDSPSSFTSDYVFSSVEDTYKAILSVYQTFASGYYDQRLSTYFSFNTDVESSHCHAQADNSRRDIWSYRCTSSNSEILGAWNNSYLAINRANECIEGIKASELYQEGDENMNHMLGEALAIRAYYYYLLVNYWGDVPFKTTATKAGDEFYLPRTSRDTILSHVIKDLIEIEPEMKWADELSEGIERISRDFVIAMISRFSLARGGYALREDGSMRRPDDYLDYYELANQYCNKLIELKPRTLDSDFQQMFRNECKFILTTNMDVIFEVPYLPGTNGDIGWNVGIRVDAGTHDYGTGNNYLNTPVNYYHSFDTNDLRLPVTCCLYYYDENLEQQPLTWCIFISTHKWSRTWLETAPGETSAKATGINFPLIRYADVLLMLAETENELNNGPTQLAKDAFAEVRQRAFPTNLWTEKVDNYIADASADKETFFNAIVDERAWEFGGECIRKFDLIRWNLLGKKIVETINTLTNMARDSQLDTGEYSYLPDTIYYRSVNGEIEFYNPYRRATEIPPLKDVPNIGDNPDGYEVMDWLTGLWDEEANVPDEFMSYQYAGYTDPTGLAPVPYILPIHHTIVNSSRGALDNNGYLLND